MLSSIQIRILSSLLKNQGLRYSEAKPSDVENDLYNYHLQFLVSKNYIEKKKDRYFLTDKGKKYVQRMDVKGELKSYFKFSVLPYVIRKEKNKKEILLQKRLRHPYYGDIGTVSGKVHIGEGIEDAANRKLKEETGLIAEFKLLGVIRKIRRDKEEKIIEDTLYHVCLGENSSGDLIEKNDYGENIWASFDVAIKTQRKNITAGKETEKILRRIRDRKYDLFYFHEDIVLPRY